MNLAALLGWYWSFVFSCNDEYFECTEALISTSNDFSSWQQLLMRVGTVVYRVIWKIKKKTKQNTELSKHKLNNLKLVIIYT